MKRRNYAGVVAVAFGMSLTGMLAFSQTEPPTRGPAVDGSPAWFPKEFLTSSPGGHTMVDAEGRVTIVPRDEAADYSTTSGGRRHVFTHRSVTS